MATIVIATNGTEGDHLPIIGARGLACALVARGHEVRVGVNAAVAPRVGTAGERGLTAFVFGDAIDAAVAQRHARAWDHWTPREPEVEGVASDLTTMARALIEAARGADLVLVNHGASFVGSLAAEMNGFPPWGSIAVTPDAFDHGAHSLEAIEAAGEDPLTRQVMAMARTRLGTPGPLPPLSRWSRVPRTLLLSSPHFSRPRPAEHFPEVVQVGFVPGEIEGKGMPEGLEEFLAAGPAPVVLALSSQPLAEPVGLLRAFVEGTALAGLRLVVQSGWAGLSAEMLERPAPHVCFIGPAAHRALFPRTSAVVCHGGIGTLVNALSAGRPVLVVPFGNDQFFNARRAVELGVGAAMHPHRLGAVGVSRVLCERVLTAEVRARSQSLADAFATERGLEDATACIESWLASRVV